MQKFAQTAVGDLVQKMAIDLLNNPEGKRYLQEAIISAIPAVVFARANNSVDMYHHQLTMKIGNDLANFPRRY